ncbi:MAG: RNA polymerase-binding protein DksA [Desulfuromonadales bacterium]|nr:RNA polymerase-binding protein DksA [Desulfuromonadales bacterium]
MKKEKLEYFRQVLNEEMNNLLQEAEKTVSEMTSENVNFPDPNDRATQESDRSFELRIRDRERKLINKIKEALDRIDDGTFGICEICGEEISEGRLKARPVTTLCIDCKMEEERKERHN